MSLLRIGSCVAVACALAACGRSEPRADTTLSAGTVTDSGMVATPSPSMQDDSATGAAASLATASTTDAGTYLTDANGRALYMFEKDARDASRCTGECAQEWPPFTATTTASADSAVQSSMLNKIIRSDNTTQSTYNGMPLYYYHDDDRAGEIEGHGKNEFGGKWYLVSPSGSRIEKGEGNRS